MLAARLSFGVPMNFVSIGVALSVIEHFSIRGLSEGSMYIDQIKLKISAHFARQT
jgi:hypothetical protein